MRSSSASMYSLHNAIPGHKCAWARLVKLDGDDLELQYRHTLEKLGKQGGILGTIFRKEQNTINAGRPWPASCGQLLVFNKFSVNLSEPR